MVKLSVKVTQYLNWLNKILQQKAQSSQKGGLLVLHSSSSILGLQAGWLVIYKTCTSELKHCKEALKG